MTLGDALKTVSHVGIRREKREDWPNEKTTEEM